MRDLLITQKILFDDFDLEIGMDVVVYLDMHD